MQKVDLYNSLIKVISAILPIQRCISEQVQERSELFDVFMQYARDSKDFGRDEQIWIEIFDLEFLGEPQFWDDMMAASYDTYGEKIEFVSEAMEKISELLRPYSPEQLQDYLANIEQSHQKRFDVLSVILIENQHRLSSPTRVVEIVESVEMMYEAFASMEEESTTDLGVLACDSGLDKTFYFVGLASIVMQVRQLILSLWDRVIFYKEKNVEDRNKLICDSLPIFEQLTDLTEELGEMQCKMIKRKLSGATLKFLRSGATIPEIEATPNNNPRQLLAPQQILMTESALLE